GWPWAFDVIASNFPLGVGRSYMPPGTRFTDLESYLGSTPLVAMVWAGLPGLMALLAAYVAIVAAGSRIGARTTIFGLWGIAHSFLESWLVAGSSPLLLTFVAALLAIAGYEARHKGAGRVLNCSGRRSISTRQRSSVCSARTVVGR